MFLGFVSGSSSGRLNLSISQNDLLSLSLSPSAQKVALTSFCVLPFRLGFIWAFLFSGSLN